MFGAPPVGHVMDPQFKPLFLRGLWKYVSIQIANIT